jgi:hypothetical protein
MFGFGGDGSSAFGPYRSRESKRSATVDKIRENSADVAAQYLTAGLEGTRASLNAWQIGISVIGHRVLGPVKRFVEIAGMAIGALSGHFVMAAACFKAWVHDKSYDLLVSGIKSAIIGDRSRSGRRSSSGRTKHRTPGRPYRAIRSSRPSGYNPDDSRAAPMRSAPAYEGRRPRNIPPRAPTAQRRAPAIRGEQASVPPRTSPVWRSAPAYYGRRPGSVPPRIPSVTPRPVPAHGRAGIPPSRRSALASAPGIAPRTSRPGRAGR